MGDIRKQSISSSVLIYIGFAFGALNTILLTKQGFFDPAQYGLMQAMISINQVFYSFACFGVVSIMSRFYPYYYDSLKKNQNDLLTLAFAIAMIGFVLVVLGGFLFKPLFIQKFSEKSPEVVNYYFWLFPFTFFYLIFSILEAHAAIFKRTVFPNFLREGAFRMCTTVLILLYIFKLISFDLFIKIFACSYGVTAILLFAYLKKFGEIRFVFRISKVTRKRGKEIGVFIVYVFLGLVVFTLAQQADSISIASQQGAAQLGIYSLCTYIATVVQVPQRSMVAIATPYMAQAWKDANYPEIQRIYFRSSINLLIISLFIFCNIWLNLDEAYKLFNFDKAYEAGKYVILILGITKIIDMGTGVNSQLLYTSPSWRFEFYAGMILAGMAIPLNYFLVRHYGIMGAAYSGIISNTIYNAIRILYIYKKYNMQPFNIKTISSIACAIGAYFIIYFLTGSLGGWLGMIGKSILFSSLFILAIYQFKLTPDFMPIVDSIKTKLKRR
ncbi:MAG: lipopolysaccharide biosynthesis protein [Chitinophagaceae bacterium]